MSKEEIKEYIKAKREPISHCVDLTKYFIGRHKTLPVYLTTTFEQEFNSSMYELERLREENKQLKDNWNELKKYAKENLYFYSGYQGEDREEDLSIKYLLEKMQELEGKGE